MCSDSFVEYFLGTHLPLIPYATNGFLPAQSTSFQIVEAVTRMPPPSGRLTVKNLSAAFGLLLGRAWLPGPNRNDLPPFALKSEQLQNHVFVFAEIGKQRLWGADS